MMVITNSNQGNKYGFKWEINSKTYNFPKDVYPTREYIYDIHQTASQIVPSVLVHHNAGFETANAWEKQWICMR